MKQRVAIYVACHKPFLKISGKSFLRYMEMGGVRNQSHFLPLTDNDTSLSDGSISHKNHNYNELTAQYWAYKNAKEDIIGICHYRRYFGDPDKRGRHLFFSHCLLGPKKISKILSHHDVIVTDKLIFPISCQDRIDTPYSALRKKDIPLVRKIILDLYGPEYAASFDIVMQRNFGFLFNMFVAKKEWLNGYSGFLFSVLKRLEEQIDESELIGAEKRIYGLWGEYLLGTFIQATNSSIYEVPVIGFDYRNVRHYIRSQLKRILNFFGMRLKRN